MAYLSRPQSSTRRVPLDTGSAKSYRGKLPSKKSKRQANSLSAKGGELCHGRHMTLYPSKVYRRPFYAKCGSCGTRVWLTAEEASRVPFWADEVKTYLAETGEP